MTEEEKEFSKKINIDKAKGKLTIALIVSILDLFTYLIPLLGLEVYDFGILFEIATFVFILMARKSMIAYDEIRSKKYVICAMVPIGWLLIYDVFSLLSSVQNIVELVYLGYGFYIEEICFIAMLGLFFAIHKDLAKADNPEKYKESTDWFYERLDEEEKNNQ